ncbi:MAG: HNH endonuclease [Proteobacteria bacterium]|nr:MAG: HNH endonuclease [Pseudomonadota bacterium]
MALMRNIERLQELLSHKNFGDRLDLLFEYVCEIALLELEKASVAEPVDSTQNNKHGVIVLAAVPVAENQDATTPMPAEIASAFSKTEKLNRHIPEKNKRFVWKRDGGCCQYRDEETNRVCGSRRWVQLDHIIEFSLGGSHEPSNLRLLCGAHNRFMYASRFRKRQAAESFA